MERMVLVQDVYIECVQCIVELVISVRHRRNSVHFRLISSGNLLQNMFKGWVACVWALLLFNMTNRKRNYVVNMDRSNLNRWNRCR